MAGIGFELRKIYGKKTLASNIWGTVYATMTVIGPSVLFSVLLLALMLIMSRSGIPEIEQQFFISSFTYIFMGAILVTAVLNTVVSRYISDCIFERRDEDLASSVFGVVTTTSAASGVIMLALCIGMYLHDNIPLYFLILYYLLGVLSTAAYMMITYVSALKQYSYVTGSYLGGLVVGFLCFLGFYKLMHMHIILAAYLSLVIGFFLIDFMLIFLCMRAFGRRNNRYFKFLSYIVKYPKLVVSGGCYMLGFYITSIIYWNFSDLSQQVSIFRTAPTYDLAMFLAIVVNMPSLVVFVVRTETAFYERYVSYLSALNKGSYDLLEKERQNTVNMINYQLFFIYEVQLIITIVLICVVNVLFPYINGSTHVLNMFMVLAMGIYCAFCMYFTIIFLYYFDDQGASCYGPVVFLAVSTALALLFCFMGKPYYPVAMLAGGILGWIITFIKLKKRLQTLNSFLLCK